MNTTPNSGFPLGGDALPKGSGFPKGKAPLPQVKGDGLKEVKPKPAWITALINTSGDVASVFVESASDDGDVEMAANPYDLSVKPSDAPMAPPGSDANVQALYSQFGDPETLLERMEFQFGRSGRTLFDDD